MSRSRAPATRWFSTARSPWPCEQLVGSSSAHTFWSSRNRALPAHVRPSRTVWRSARAGPSAFVVEIRPTHQPCSGSDPPGGRSASRGRGPDVVRAGSPTSQVPECAGRLERARMLRVLCVDKRPVLPEGKCVRLEVNARREGQPHFPSKIDENGTKDCSLDIAAGHDRPSEASASAGSLSQLAHSQAGAGTSATGQSCGSSRGAAAMALCCSSNDSHKTSTYSVWRAGVIGSEVTSVDVPPCRWPHELVECLAVPVCGLDESNLRCRLLS